jgi:hypothetical protein
LPKVFWASKCLEKHIFVLNGRYQADYVDKVLLFDSDAGQVATTRGFDFAFLALLPFRRSLLLDFVLLVELELFRCWYLVLYRFLIVDPATIWTCTLLVGGFQTVETELADL